MFSWNNTEKPIIGLAPMDGVTDYPMREIQADIAKPDVMYTEFISVEGYSRAPKNFKDKLTYSESQRPIIVQLFGHTPSDFETSCKMLLERGFNGFDINMGCPARTVVQSGGGCALVENHNLAGDIIQACLKITQKNNIPLSVKTRIGVNDVVTKDWISFLSQFPLDCIAVHGRLLKDVHSGEVNWDEIEKGSEIAHSQDIVYLGNGGVSSIEEGIKLSKQYELDGVLIGQAAMGNPWAFKDSYKPNEDEKLETLVKHAKLAEEFYGTEGFVTVRKHLAWYCKGIPSSKKLRAKLVRSNSSDDVEKMVEEFKNSGID